MPTISPLPPKYPEKSKKKALVEVAVFVYVVVVFSFWLFAIFSDKGMVALYRARAEYEKAKQEYERVSAESEKLQKEIADLENNPMALEAIAREELHMIKPGEKIYLFTSARAKN